MQTVQAVERLQEKGLRVRRRPSSLEPLIDVEAEIVLLPCGGLWVLLGVGNENKGDEQNRGQGERQLQENPQIAQSVVGIE